MSYRFPYVNIMKTGMNIERLRKERGYSVKDLQGLFGFESPQAIYKWQWGETLPTIDNLIVLATIFKVRIEDILVIEGA